MRGEAGWGPLCYESSMRPAFLLGLGSYKVGSVDEWLCLKRGSIACVKWGILHLCSAFQQWEWCKIYLESI